MFTHLLVSVFFINIKKNNKNEKIILFFISKILNRFFILYYIILKTSIKNFNIVS